MDDTATCDVRVYRTDLGQAVWLQVPALTAQRLTGNLGADALADADSARWRVSAWRKREPMLTGGRLVTGT